MPKHKPAEPDVKALQSWATKALRGVEQSHIFTMLWAPSVLNIAEQPVAALQFAAAVLLGKPLYVLAPEGTTLPPRVLLVADGVEYYADGDQDSMKRAMIRLLSKSTGVDVRM